MGKKSKLKRRSAPIEEAEDSDAMLAMLIEEEEAADSPSHRNFFQDLAENSGNEGEEEKSDLALGYSWENPRKRPISEGLDSLEVYRMASEPLVDSTKDQLRQKVACYQSALEEKSSKLKAALQEKDLLMEKSRKMDAIQTKLVNALVKVDELEEKLSRKKEKYRGKLEEVERFIKERDQLKKAELFSQHYQNEVRGKMAQIDPLFKQNKDLVEANARLRQELESMRTVVQTTQASRDKAVEAIQAKLSAANKALSAVTMEKSAELAAAGREVNTLKQSLKSAKEHEAALTQQLGLYQVLTYDHVSLEDCQQLLSSHLEAASSIQRTIQRKSESAKCVVCLVGERKVLLLPCAHLMLCGECAEKLTFCPICRAVIATKVKVQN